MKKFMIGLVVGLNLGVFFGTTLHAQDFNNTADLIKQEHNENVSLDSKENIIIAEEENIDEECKNKVMSFFGIFVEDNKKSINLTKEYKDCVAKKQNRKEINL